LMTRRPTLLAPSAAPLFAGLLIVSASLAAQGPDEARRGPGASMESAPQAPQATALPTPPLARRRGTFSCAASASNLNRSKTPTPGRRSRLSPSSPTIAADKRRPPSSTSFLGSEQYPAVKLGGPLLARRAHLPQRPGQPPTNLRWPLFDGWMVEQLRKETVRGTTIVNPAALAHRRGRQRRVAPRFNFPDRPITANPVEIAPAHPPAGRSFLGVQIQCAQCHRTAKTEPWKSASSFTNWSPSFGRAKLVQHKDCGAAAAPPMPSKGPRRRPRPVTAMDRQEGPEPASFPMTAAPFPHRRRSVLGRRQRRPSAAKAPSPSWWTSPKKPVLSPRGRTSNRTWTAMEWAGASTPAPRPDLGGPDEPPQFSEALDLLAKEWTAKPAHGNHCAGCVRTVGA